jgi:hypothetical protein
LGGGELGAGWDGRGVWWWRMTEGGRGERGGGGGR